MITAMPRIAIAVRDMDRAIGTFRDRLGMPVYEFPWLKKRLPSVWTRSKFISSVGAVTLEVVQRYIETQKGV